QRGVRGHAEIMDELAVAADRRGGLLDGARDRAGAFRQRYVVERLGETRPGALRRLVVVVIKRDRLFGEGAKRLDVDFVERHADGPAVGDEPFRGQMEKPRQELALREIAGRAEQYHDLRQFRT